MCYCCFICPCVCWPPYSIKSKPEGAATAGSPITVTAKVRRNQAPVGSVVLLVRINYTPEQQIAMTAQEGGGDAASGMRKGGNGRQAATVCSVQCEASCDCQRTA